MSNLFHSTASILILALSFSTACGTAYRTTVGEGDDAIPVLVVSGTPFEMGKSIGQLAREEIQKCMKTYMTICQTAEPDRTSNEKLDAAWEAVSPYVDDRFKEEIKGLAEGSGLSEESLIRGHMVPVVSDYSCSGVAVWGKATKDGHLYQIRNLDFTMHGQLQEFPVLVVYLPDEGQPHILPTFMGCIGANTGMNAAGIALGEKGGSPEKEYPFDMNGNHFMMLFRDLLYDADGLDEAVQMIRDEKLIKRYHLYVGDGTGADKGAMKVRISMPDEVKINVWGANDPTDEVAPNISENAIYYTMNNDKCYQDIQAMMGQYDADSMIALSRAVADEDGNLLNVVYDATDLELYVSYAHKMECAHKRPYVYVNLKDYLDPTKLPEGAQRLSGF